MEGAGAAADGRHQSGAVSLLRDRICVCACAPER